MARETTIRVVIEGVDKTGPAFSKATSQAKGFVGGIGKSIAVFTGAQLAANALAGAISSLTGTVSGLVKGSFQMAGTFQEMEFTALAVGRAMGLTEREIRGSIEALNEAGIRYDVAAKATATLARNQIDLSKATELATIAQATGILVGQDSSATMESLTRAAVTGNTFMLRRMGIMVNLTDVVKHYAQSQGVAVEALSQREIAEVRLQAIIDNSAAIMDVYEEAMESPTKALRSLAGRVIPELQAALGQTFLPAWATAITAIDAAAKAFTGALKEGGALYPIMINLGAVASIVADAFSALVRSFIPVEQTLINIGGQIASSQRSLMGLGDTAQEAGDSFLSNLVNSLADAASAAFRGGIEIVAALAEGIVQGVASSLSAVMNWLSGVLSGWLAPGSAPRIAKDIVQWGAETFTEYLQGFTDADFDVLEGLQAPIQNVLQSLVSLGDIGAGQAGQAFKDITQELAVALDAFAETGKVDVSVFEKLTNVGGRYGKQIAELARRQFEFAAATREVERSQQALTDAMSAQENAQGALETIMEEFNTALREGAAPEVLDAKRAEFLQAKASLAQSKKEVKEAKKQNKAAIKRTGPLKKQVSLQERLLKQLIEFTKVQKESVAATIAGVGVKPRDGVGAGALAFPIPDLPTPADFDIGSSIKAAVDDAKALLKERLADLFAPITTVWEETVLPRFDELKEQWSELFDVILQVAEDKWPAIQEVILNAWDAIVQTWESVLRPALEGLWLFIRDNLNIILPVLASIILVNVIPALIAAAAAFTVAALPIVALGVALVALGLLWKKHGKQVTKTAKQIKFIVVWALNKAAQAVRQAWFIIKFVTIDTLNTAAQAVEEGMFIIKFTIISFLNSIRENWRSIWNNLRTIVSTIWDRIITTIRSKAGQLGDVIKGAIGNLVAAVEGIFIALIAKARTFIDDFFQLGADIVVGLEAGMKRKLGEIVAWFSAAIAEVIARIDRMLGRHSPPAVFVEIGEDIMKGLAMGIQNAIELPVNAMTVGTRDTMAAARQTTNEFNFNITATEDLVPSIVYGYETVRALASVTA